MRTRFVRFLRSPHTTAIMLSLLVGISIPLLHQNLVEYQKGQCEKTYTLLNPLRRCLPTPPPLKEEYDVFEKKLQSWVDEEKKNGIVTHVSIYFRDLENGPTFGIEGAESFSPASLLKVPIMLALLKQAEIEPEILSDQMSFTGPLGNYENIQDPVHSLQSNQEYSLDELLRRMIVYSDNDAKELIKLYLQKRYPKRELVSETYNSLGILQREEGLDSTIGVKTYASIFRLLYNASYLSRDMSEKALNLLSQVAFKDGLVAGVPPGITIAHKFGVREGVKGQHQLHDCGIVYQPETPYLLCVMTRGLDANHNAAIIQEISRAMYEEVLRRATTD